MSKIKMFSKEETEKIEDLRKRVKDRVENDSHLEDFFLIRWLRARNMNVVKAEEMLIKSLAWRKETGADTILDKEEIPIEYRKKFMFGVFGEDEAGCPIIFVPAGRHNHRIIIEAEGLEKSLRYNIVWIEKVMKIIRECGEKSGKAVYTYHEVLDMEHYSYKAFAYKPAIDYILQTQKMFDDNYPDVLKTVIVINAPKIFSLLFALLKPMIPKDTLEKISIYGCDVETWKEVFVQKGFPMHKFPPRWGGVLEGSDEFCSQEDVWYDFPIPLKHFKEVPEEDEEGFFTVKVGARDKTEIKQVTTEDGSRIDWKFKTENHDISFQLSFQDENSKQEIVMVPLERVDSHKKVQEGSRTVNTRGVFVLRFDNKYSYTKSKIVKYQVCIAKA